MLSAVITGDIVRSQALSKEEEKKLLKQISLIAGNNSVEFYRGDSFQLYLKDAVDALKLGLQLRCAAKRIEPAEGTSFDIRLSIGLGAVKKPVGKLALAKGEAFVLSGRVFDDLAYTERRLAINSPSEEINIAFDLLAHYVDTLLYYMTPRQAGIIYELLEGYTQKEAARRLKITQATASQHARAANWSAVSFVLDKFVHYINVLSP